MATVVEGTCTTICKTNPGSCCQAVSLTAGGADTTIKLCAKAGNNKSSSIACESTTACGKAAAAASITITDNLVFQTAKCTGGDKAAGAFKLAAAHTVLASAMAFSMY